MIRGVLVRSSARFERFRQVLEENAVETVTIDLDDPASLHVDLRDTDLLVFFPEFAFSSNSPMAVAPVRDFITHVHACFPHVETFPDATIVDFYNDKYRQYLFLESHGLPIPPTIPLVSAGAVRQAERAFGYPMVVKNRFGAGGAAVRKVESTNELWRLFRVSQLDLFQLGAAVRALRAVADRAFLYHLIKRRRMEYPFLSPPLLAQRFVRTDRDVRVVVGDGRVVEAHWRIQAAPGQWKVNIDGGGIGRWSAIPDEVMSVCTDAARQLGAHWVAFDVLKAEDGGFLFTEFSPVWHHYALREKPSFEYGDDYNVEVPIERGLDLERLIVESLVARVLQRRERRITPAG